MSTPPPLWPLVQDFLLELTGQRPDLNGALFLIGIQELGQGTRPFSKEEKQDLMHIGICTILQVQGYWQLTHRDEQGWPHFAMAMPMPLLTLEEQEAWLQGAVCQYFAEVL